MITGLINQPWYIIAVKLILEPLFQQGGNDVTISIFLLVLAFPNIASSIVLLWRKARKLALALSLLTILNMILGLTVAFILAVVSET